MATAFVSSQFAEGFGAQLRKVAEQAGKPVEFITVPEEKGARLPQSDCDRIDCTFIDRDIRFNEQTAAAYEKALIEALRSGGLGGAALDAHVQEPLPADSPLWSLPNVIVSPHNASASTGNERRSAEMFIANYAHWARGEPMFHVQQVE